MKKKYATHAKSEFRKNQIIAAALICFTELGYMETSMADISRRSKASIGSIYHHFGSKDQLAAAVYLEGIRDYQTGLMSAMENRTTAREGIQNIVRFHLRWVKENLKWAQFLFQKRYAEFMGETEVEFIRLNLEFLERLTKWFSLHIKAGRIKNYPMDVTISLLLGPCQEFSRQYIAGISRSNIDTVADELAHSAWLSLYAEN
jgi:AcrR family transcriptional regulator